MTDRKQICFSDAKKLLEKYDIKVSGEICSNNIDALSSAAERLGYPVVLKTNSEQIVHKSDIGAVILRIRNKEELEEAVKRIEENIKKAGYEKQKEFLLQKMAEPGFEILVGAHQDPIFGPLIIVGSGGKYVELLKDSAPGIGLLTEEDVKEMLSLTKAGKIIDGYRGEPLDEKVVISIAINISRLMAENKDILEIDLNPIVLYKEGFSLVDVRVIKGIPAFMETAPEIPEKRKNSLNKILNPESVAIIGASHPGKIGGIVLKNCLRIKKIYPVNPNLDYIQGLKCYRTVKDLPEPPDVGVFLIKAEAVVQEFEEFCKIGGKGAIVISDGFAEAGRKDLDDRLFELSNEYGVAYIGPNCLGVINNFSGLNSFFIPEHRTSNIEKPNGVGIISQSGGIGMEIIEMMKADNMNLGKLVSIGNASGVGIPEILDNMGEDPDISVIGIYLEGIKNGRQFLDIGKKVTKKKPVLIIKGGTGGGAEATMSHTATLAGNVNAFRACCRQAGFYLIDKMTEDPKILVNILSLLTTNPVASGNRVAIVSVGGGAGILLADQVTDFGMTLAVFSEETKYALQNLIKTKKLLGTNPVDILGDSDDERLLEAIRIIDKDPNVDGIITAIYLQVPYLSEYLPDKLVDLKKSMTKPMLVSPRGFSNYVFNTRRYLYEKDFPTYTIPMIKPMSIAFKIWKQYGRAF
ncbi:MAG: acetate--CoA ligase family protein [Spirochaetaceae bacterium]|nr:acetate--CoA ligase family protein [Spirochaetaceae bacterium]